MQEKRFFHWDLEFPEVFVDLARRDWAENPGFDAVIGNPPYVRQEQLTPNKPWLQARLRSIMVWPTSTPTSTSAACTSCGRAGFWG